MDLPETQRAGLTGCMWDSINHLPTANQGNQLGGWRWEYGEGNTTAKPGCQPCMAQPNTVGAGSLVGSGVECAPAHRAGQVWASRGRLRWKTCFKERVNMIAHSEGNKTPSWMLRGDYSIFSNMAVQENE